MRENAPSPRLRLLFLDDDPELRRVIGRSFEAKSYEVAVAEELEEAAALLACRPFDAFCTDLSLDRLERFEVLDLIREARATHPELGIVVHTGCDRAEVHATCRAIGANAVVLKRGSLEPLHEAVGASLGARAVA
ncbi:MAG: response regulator [Thermoanaerobaculia bacterium]